MQIYAFSRDFLREIWTRSWKRIIRERIRSCLLILYKFALTKFPLLFRSVVGPSRTMTRKINSIWRWGSSYCARRKKKSRVKSVAPKLFIATRRVHILWPHMRINVKIARYPRTIILFEAIFTRTPFIFPLARSKKAWHEAASRPEIQGPRNVEKRNCRVLAPSHPQFLESKQRCNFLVAISTLPNDETFFSSPNVVSLPSLSTIGEK